jgi:hypothetical protein
MKGSIDAPELRRVLLSRGVALNPPASADTLDRLARWAGGTLHADVAEVLKEFDGFASGDFEIESFISVWPTATALTDDWSKPPTLAFSDWFISAFVFGVDPSAGGPVVNIEAGKVVAPTYADFWSLLLSDPDRLL